MAIRSTLVILTVAWTLITTATTKALEPLEGNTAWFNIIRQKRKSKKFHQVRFLFDSFNLLRLKSFAIDSDASEMNNGWKHLSQRFSGAVCIPSSCSSSTVAMLMKHIFNGTDLRVAQDYQQSDFCQTRSTKKFQAIDSLGM